MGSSSPIFQDLKKNRWKHHLVFVKSSSPLSAPSKTPHFPFEKSLVPWLVDRKFLSNHQRCRAIPGHWNNINGSILRVDPWKFWWKFSWKTIGDRLLNESNKSKHKQKSDCLFKHNYVNSGEVDRYLFSHFYDNVIFWILKLQGLEKLRICV